MEVSAMFVDMTHFLTPSGAMSKTCKGSVKQIHEQLVTVHSVQYLKMHQLYK